MPAGAAFAPERRPIKPKNFSLQPSWVAARNDLTVPDGHVRTEDLKEARGRHKRVPKRNGLKFERVFSREEVASFEEIEREHRTADSVGRRHDGRTTSEATQIVRL
jgi:hypothetical protein